MFLQPFFRKKTPRQRSDRFAKQRIEALEDRCLLADYTWVGPANGLWSAGANWRDAANNPGVPGAADTVIFNNTNNKDSKMDLARPASGPTVSKMRVEGHTGTIHLQTTFGVDILEMSSGTITRDSTTFSGSRTIWIRQDNNSRTFGASTWTGGTIGGTGGALLDVFNLVGTTTHPLTFNVGHATNTPTFACLQWFVGENCTVNWDKGDINMAAGAAGAVVGEIMNAGDFVAKSGGKISAPAGKTWWFTNGGTLTLKGNNQFERNKLRAKPGGTIKKAALDGTPGTFTLIGEVAQEGGNVEVESGTFAVIGPYEKTDGSVSVFSGATLTSTDDFTQSAGSTSLGTGATLSVTAAVDCAGGSFVMGEATLVATDGFNIGSGATFTATGTIEAEVQTAGTWNHGDSFGSAALLSVAGSVTQTGGTLTIESGDLLVRDNFVKTGGNTYLNDSVPAPATLAISGSYSQSGGNCFVILSAILDVGSSVTLSGGQLNLADLGSLQAGNGLSIQSGGRLSGNGTLTADVVNAGTLDVGCNGTAGNISVVGNYTQTSTGVLRFEVGVGNSVGQLNVSGTATLAGTLVLTLQTEVMPAPPDTLTLLTWGSSSGTFDTLDLPALDNGIWDPRYNDPTNTFTLWILED